MAVTMFAEPTARRRSGFRRPCAPAPVYGIVGGKAFGDSAHGIRKMAEDDEDDEEDEDDEDAEDGDEDDEDDDEEGEGKSSKGGKSKLILFIVIGVVVLLVAGGATAYFLGAFDSLFGGGGDAAATEGGAGGGGAGGGGGGGGDAATLRNLGHKYELPEITLKLKPSGRRPHAAQLRVTLMLGRAEEEDILHMDQAATQITDALQAAVADFSIQDLRGASGPYLVREILLKQVPPVAKPVLIRDILITNFLVQ
jgi:flagellar FliL protein